MGEFMIGTVWNNIKHYSLIHEKDTIVIGVSGGPDSMALLYALLEIKKSLDFNILIAHVNHGVRGDDALADQLFVEKISKGLALPCYSINVDMEAHAKEMGITSEEAGRDLRYGFFRDILNKYGGGKIAVAHNKDDQAETLLLRLMRGTGIDGLKGMDFICGDIIRPLLNISRYEIEEYIEKGGIETVLDKTNLLPIYSRNKVRLELLPYIRENFNPSIIDALWRLSRTSNGDCNFLEKYTEDKFDLLVKNKTNHSIILNGSLFNKEDMSIRLRIIRKAICKLLGNLHGFSEQHITQVVEIFERLQTGKRIELPNSLVGRVNYDEFIIEKKKDENIKDFNYILQIGNNEFKELGISLNVSIIQAQMPVKFKDNAKYFDYDKVKGNIYIRNRKPGDIFNPIGMRGTKKVKDYFIDKKISKDIRDRIPILMDDKNIIWILGYATSQLYKITEGTKNILMVEYNKV